MTLPNVISHQPFIKTCYIGMTESHGSRVKATNMTSGKSVYVSWDAELDVLQNHTRAAVKLYEKLEQTVPERMVACGTKDSRGYIFTDYPKRIDPNR